MIRKIIAAAAALCLAISTMTSSLALYDDDFICTIRGGSSQNLFGDSLAEIQYSQMTLKMYSPSVFRGQANMTFRAYKPDGSEKWSHAISFYPGDVGKRKLSDYINGATLGAYIVVYGSIPSKEKSDNAYFDGLLKL